MADSSSRSDDRKRRAALAVALWASIFLLILGFKNAYSRNFLNSDILWTIAFLDDLFLHGGHLADWNLSNHTDFFPDKMVSLGVWWAVRHSYDWFLIFYASMSYALWVVTARFLTGSYWIALLSAFTALVLMNLGIGTNILLTPFFPSFHFMAMCLGVLACLLLQRSSSRWPALCAAALVLFAVFMSDRLIVLYTAAYMIATVVIDFALHRVWCPHMKRMVLFGAIVVMALAVHDSFWNAFTNVSSIPSPSLGELSRMHGGSKRSCAVAIASVLSLFCVPWFLRLMRRRPQFKSAYVLVFSGVLGG